MNNKKKTIILIALFVILMAGASVLYNNLSADYKMDSLLVENNNFQNDTNNSSNSASSEASAYSSNTASNETDDYSSNSASSKTDDYLSNSASGETDDYLSNSASGETDDYLSNSASGETNDNTSNDAANDTNEDASNTNKTETSQDTSSEESSSENKNIAPNFTVFDLECNQVNLTDFFGKPVIVNFWASWCGPCQMEMPDFNDAYAAYKDEIVFLMVNMTDGSRETLEKASSFIEEKGYSFPVYYDTEYSAAITYSVSSLPTTYFIDAEGNLIAHARGAIDADTLQKGIDMIYRDN